VRLANEHRQIKIDPLLTVTTLAALLSVHKNTVYELIRQGKLDSYDIPERSIRIPQSSVARYIESRRREPGSEFNLKKA
jgi:excisionase family DNA binding protein